jgi:hypothetical protein
MRDGAPMEWDSVSALVRVDVRSNGGSNPLDGWLADQAI